MSGRHRPEAGADSEWPDDPLGPYPDVGRPAATTPSTEADPNPYVEGSHEYHVWMFGYNKGRAEARRQSPPPHSCRQGIEPCGACEAADALAELAQLVADTSNDPHLVREAERILAEEHKDGDVRTSYGAERDLYTNPERTLRASVASPAGAPATLRV